MKVRRMAMVVIIVGLVAIGYFATVGWSEPVKDFTPEQPTPPATPPTTDPIAYATFNYTAVVYTRLTGAVYSSVPTISPYVSAQEGRVFKNSKLNLQVSPIPPPVNTTVEGYVTFTVTGQNTHQTWQSDKFTVTEFPTTISGQTGRVFFYQEGPYLFSCSLILDTGITGDVTTVATFRGTLVVDI